MPTDLPLSLPRRTALAGAAWSIPAIALITATPAVASSASPLLTLTTPRQQIPAAGDTVVTATLTTSQGVPDAGRPVTFTVPTGATVTPATATTDTAGIATTTVNLATPWRTPGSTAVITAIAAGASATQPLTVLGANALAAGNWGSGLQTTAGSPVFRQIELAFPSPIAQIASSVFLLLEDGTVWTRGTGSSGQLGTGTTNDREAWSIVPGLNDVVQIASGLNRSHYARRSDGSLWVWGNNGSGQLGLGTTTNVSVPTRHPLIGVSQVAARRSSAFALVGGAVYGWGLNDFGQVGNGVVSSTTPVTSPVRVIAADAAQIAALGTGCAVRMSDGSVRIWGYNYTASPTVFSGVGPLRALNAAGRTYYATRTDGAIYSWLSNRNGQMGNGTTSIAPATTTSSAVIGLSSGVLAVAGNGEEGIYEGSGYALRSDGTLRSWGVNADGQLGDGTTLDRPTPVTPVLPAGTPAVSHLHDMYGRTFAVIVETA